MSFALRTRPRRLRSSAAIRELVSETLLHPKHFVLPLFVEEGISSPKAIAEMPGVERYPPEKLTNKIENSLALGVRAFLLFGVPLAKDELGSHAYSKSGVIQKTLTLLKSSFGKDVLLIADTCLCEYTSHGHCGYVQDGKVLNDRSLELLAKTAVSQAEAGADFVAPSAMMDGQVKAIREALDQAGFFDTGILAYSAKFASSLYGPFRAAADSRPQFGDRKGYQMDYRNVREALKEVELDVKEGADIVMVKPALPYLDVITKVRESFNLPVAAYQVSGEYSMIKAASKAEMIDEKAVVLETLYSIKRAGADIIITYYAEDAARWLSE
ncbi:delta-aminolevulinic acid dehydratase [Candidatus Marsarchaeota G2 archaeon ECH_B_SAG-G16]|uniref:Delta-aminolevulinic acid dehydratase n=3 Tax=Candidatus Marsarchaeota TaxID=1978152 RepID=A0A2R6A665_9ARCH|nr:MAG: delta-aminolevulinic acid dehydratase [Candidatus Marsarchaeota G1 archaeon OSP_D]PSN86483.1 MAG: delta-aminolevulinic acid dehydratase [Candidatus Marsarchaeota G1 archaeon OSP_C]PSO05335.1 MAG: delta-aminolevulinic acid dehydratase [Candidatus Marsarchaeota G2 archaeon ECH_B_SAG-G16]